MFMTAAVVAVLPAGVKPKPARRGRIKKPLPAKTAAVWIALPASAN
jgi:hypothetical protein